MVTASKASTLLYDETCGFCTAIVQWVSRQERGNRVQVMPCQFALLTKKFNVTEQQCLSSIQLNLPDGTVLTKGQAVAQVLSLLWDSAWPTRIARVPGIRQVLDLGYTFIAVNRHRLPGIKQMCAAGNPNGCGVEGSSSVLPRIQPSEPAGTSR